MINGPIFIPAPYPAHPKADVIARLSSVEPGVNVSGLTDDQLMDLYVRNFYWPAGTPQRTYFGYNTDYYFEGSIRENRMRIRTEIWIERFFRQVVTDPCSTFLNSYEDPNDDEVTAFLES